MTKDPAFEELQRRLRESYEDPLRVVCRSTNPHNVLEWGPGNSTSVIAEEVPYASILSIEHHPKWFRLYQEAFKDNPRIDLQLKTISMKGGASEGYVGYPLKHLKKTGRPYNLIFIDGRHRADCLALASLMPCDPYVVIHDAKRQNYQKYFSLFKHIWHSTELNTAVLSNRHLDFMESHQVEWLNIHSVEETIKDLADRLTSLDPFFYVRFGDAEIYIMKDPLFANRRHQPKDESLSKEIVEAFGIQNKAFLRAFTVEGWKRGKLIELRRIVGEFIPHGECVTVPHVSAVHLSFLHHYPLFEKFIFRLQGRNVVLAGGPTSCNSPEVRRAFNVSETIELTDTNAYDALTPEKMKEIESHLRPGTVLLSALGHASTVLAKRLFYKHHIQFIDIGSVVDALAGVGTRNWIIKASEYVQEKRKNFQNGL